MEFRTGIGYDVHRLVNHRRLILGGVHIPFHKGLLGHSDADVLIHAVADALLGALGEGDIGKMFPDSDMRFKDVPSRFFLESIRRKYLDGASVAVTWIDAVVMAQQPKLTPFISNMEVNIARSLGISTARVNIKATTTEKLGFVGAGDGIAAQAVVTIAVRETDS